MVSLTGLVASGKEVQVKLYYCCCTRSQISWFPLNFVRHSRACVFPLPKHRNGLSYRSNSPQLSTTTTNDDDDDDVMRKREISSWPWRQGQEQEENEEEDNVVNSLKRTRESASSLDLAKVKGLGSSQTKIRTKRRSNLIARQVISKCSAFRLGFVSQLYVNTNSWHVQVVEIRPNLLSGEFSRFLLCDICQIGDVVLVENEDILYNEPGMVGLDTLIGYEIVTQDKMYLGKVRDYKFNMSSGRVSHLELDFHGIPYIPARVVSTYCLSIEDVVELASDTIITSSDVKRRMQRLTKGFWEIPYINAPWSMLIDKNSNSKEERFRYRDRIDNEIQRKLRLSLRKSEQDKHVRKSAITKESSVKNEWELPLDY